MTGHVNVSEFEKSGAHLFFRKPVPFQDLLRAMQRLFPTGSTAAL
jgi:FixJ family two-component response regulator